MISSIKDKLNNINYDVTTGNRNAGVMILLSKISDKNFSIKFSKSEIIPKGFAPNKVDM